MQLRVSLSNLQTQTGPRGPSWSALCPSHACLTLLCIPSFVSYSLRAHEAPSTGLGTGGKGKKEVSVLREFTSQPFVLGVGSGHRGPWSNHWGIHTQPFSFAETDKSRRTLHSSGLEMIRVFLYD